VSSTKTKRSEKREMCITRTSKGCTARAIRNVYQLGGVQLGKAVHSTRIRHTKEERILAYWEAQSAAKGQQKEKLGTKLRQP
jgi:hypothetical protein